MEFLYLLLLLAGLWLLSNLLTQTLYVTLFVLFRNRSIAISLVTIIFFPGTVVHELAHLFTAEILRVKTGKISLAPDTIEDPEIKMGSVAIAQTDPIRRTLIGTAPFWWGIINLTALAYVFYPFAAKVAESPITQWTNLQEFYIALGLIYLIFVISNSMYPSRSDLKGIWVVAITVVLCVGAAIIAGFRFSLTGQSLELFTQIIHHLMRSVGLVFVVNCIVLLILSIPLWIARGILR